MTIRHCLALTVIVAFTGCTSTPEEKATVKQPGGRAGQPPIAGWSNLVKKARFYLNESNGVNPKRYKLDRPILIPESMEPQATPPPGTLVGFPLKQQPSTLASQGWIELGIILFIPPEGDIHPNFFPTQTGRIYLVKVDKDDKAIEKHFAEPDFTKYRDTPNKILDPIDDTAPSAAPSKGQN